MRHIAVLFVLSVFLTLVAPLVIPIHRLTVQDSDNDLVTPTYVDDIVANPPCGGVLTGDNDNDWEVIEFEAIETVEVEEPMTTTFSAIATSTVAVTTSEVEVNRVVVDKHPVEGEDGAYVVVEEVVEEEIVETVLEFAYEPEDVTTTTGVEVIDEIAATPIDVASEEEENVTIEIIYDLTEEEDSPTPVDVASEEEENMTVEIIYDLTEEQDSATPIDVASEEEESVMVDIIYDLMEEQDSTTPNDVALEDAATQTWEITYEPVEEQDSTTMPLEGDDETVEGDDEMVEIRYDLSGEQDSTRKPINVAYEDKVTVEITYSPEDPTVLDIKYEFEEAVVDKPVEQLVRRTIDVAVAMEAVY